MRALRTPASVLVLVVLPLSLLQAVTNFGYVANNSAGTVSVINTTTHAVVTTVSVGSFPYGVAVDEAGKSVYVTNSGSNTVSVISTSTNTVVATIPVPSGPMDLALSPNGKTAYVSCSNANEVAVINTATRVVMTTIPVTNPIGIAVMPDGAFFYVVSSSPGNVLAISALTNKVVATIPVGTDIPVGVAISPDGSTAYVTGYNGNNVKVIQTATNSVTTTINVSAGPFHEAASPDGHWLYVANYNAGGGTLVTVIDTASLTVATTIVVGEGPEGVSFTQDSAFAYVPNFTSDDVSVIKTATKTVVGTINVGAGPVGDGMTGKMKVSTVVGGFVGDHLAATSAAIDGPSQAVLDSAGNVYVSDVFGNRVRKISTTGVITTYAGTGNCGYNGDNIKATSASICPQGLAWDPSGNLIVADGGNGRIRKINKTTFIITTIAGNGTFGAASGDSGPAVNADIGQPFYMNYDGAGNLYFASVGECRIRKVDTGGTITTVAGNGTCGYNSDGIAATSAELNLARGVVLDSSGNLYIADTANHVVRKVNTSGVISTFAGTVGKGGFSGDGGPATSARIGSPRALTIFNGSLYIANGGNGRIRVVNLGTNIINTYAGSTIGYDGDGHALLSSQFNGTGPVTFDASGNSYIPDTYNGRLRKASGGIVTTFAGGYLGDGGKATAAALVLPEALAIDKSGNFYIADYTGNRVRKVSAGIITTLAGSGVSGYFGDNGPATSALLNEPQGVAVDSLGNVFIADTLNNVIRKVTPAGTISTFATNPNFGYLLQMATDASNNLYVADAGSCVVWKITPIGVAAVAAGAVGFCDYNGDGIPSTTAHLNQPYGVAIDSGGNLLIADWANNRVREVNTVGTIGTIAGNGFCGWTGDGGSATTAEVCPNSVAVDKSGNIYVADFTFGRIRKISNGNITTFAGAGFGFNGDGLWPLYTTLDDPVQVAVTAAGTVYELDDVDHRVRSIK